MSERAGARTAWTTAAVASGAVVLATSVPAAGQQPVTRPGDLVAQRAEAADGEAFDFYDRGPYREDVPRPRDHLGYRIGSLHTPHSRMLGYFRALAEAAPDRIRLETYGHSYEGEPLILAFVGSSDVLDRREEVRGAVQRLAAPRGVTEGTAARLAEETPVVVWLDYGNDGNETANVEAAMQVAYQLVAGEGERDRRLREDALVVINPGHNPESHDRHAIWYNAFGVGAADPAAHEHHAPWGMSTNNNHYQIDLNRDGWSLTQRESQALAVQVLRWRPQVFVDHHGQTDQYFFPPPTPPVNPGLPEAHLRWYETFGRGNAEAFDEHGVQYYVRDVFDLFYPGYWDSWPALHGAIGMTYETDGGGSKGLRWRRDDGTILTFRDGIAHHWLASLATVETAVEHREALLRDFAAFFRGALERGRAGDPARAYVLAPGDDPRRAAALAATLLRQGVEVRRTTEPFTARGVRHATGEAGSARIPAGAYVVDMAQPDGRMASTLLRRDVPLDSAFVAEQFAIWRRNARRGEGGGREGFEFYDVTSWSLPLAWGVEAWALDALPAAGSEPLSVPGERLSGTGDWAEEIPFDAGLASGVTAVVPGPTPAAPVRAGEADAAGAAGPAAVPSAAGPRARSAYLFRPETEGSVRLLAGLLREGFRVAVSRGPLMAGSRRFPRGTFVVRVSRNPEAVHDRIRVLAADASVELTASHTAFPAEGERGPGSEDVVAVRAPRIAVAVGEGIRTTAYGHLWFTLERRWAYPFTPIRLERIGSGALDAYDVLVLPDGSSSGIERELGERGLERLEGWLERGGTMVGWGGAAAFAVEAELVETDLVRREAVGPEATDSLGAAERRAQIDRLPALPEPVPPAASPSAEPGALMSLPGAVLRGELDRTHWLTFGYSEPDLPVLAEGSDFLTVSPGGSSPVVFPEAGDLVVSGFTWPGNTERLLRGAAWSVAEPVGEGQVVLFAADPLFRLVWRATGRLLANALFVGPSLGASPGGGY